MDRNVVINQVYATINNRTGILLHDTLFINLVIYILFITELEY